jgi:hypothetical protein
VPLQTRIEVFGELIAAWIELNPGFAQLLNGDFTGAVLLTHAVFAEATAGTTATAMAMAKKATEAFHRLRNMLTPLACCLIGAESEAYGPSRRRPPVRPSKVGPGGDPRGQRVLSTWGCVRSA